MKSEADRIRELEAELHVRTRKAESLLEINHGLREEIDRLDSALIAVTHERDDANAREVNLAGALAQALQQQNAARALLAEMAELADKIADVLRSGEEAGR